MFNIAIIKLGGMNIHTSVSHVFSGLSIDILSPIKSISVIRTKGKMKIKDEDS